MSCLVWCRSTSLVLSSPAIALNDITSTCHVQYAIYAAFTLRGWGSGPMSVYLISPSTAHLAGETRDPVCGLRFGFLAKTFLAIPAPPPNTRYQTQHTTYNKQNQAKGKAVWGAPTGARARAGHMLVFIAGVLPDRHFPLASARLGVGVGVGYVS
jgi:hypothetical protein